MKVIIAGGRDFDNYQLLKEKCNFYLSKVKDVTIISGKARGADTLGELYAKEMRYELILMPADWNTYGKSAGYKRNLDMAEIADALIVFRPAVVLSLYRVDACPVAFVVSI